MSLSSHKTEIPTSIVGDLNTQKLAKNLTTENFEGRFDAITFANELSQKDKKFWLEAFVENIIAHHAFQEDRKKEMTGCAKMGNFDGIAGQLQLEIDALESGSVTQKKLIGRIGLNAEVYHKCNKKEKAKLVLVGLCCLIAACWLVSTALSVVTSVVSKVAITAALGLAAYTVANKLAPKETAEKMQSISDWLKSSAPALASAGGNLMQIASDLYPAIESNLRVAMEASVSMIGEYGESWNTIKANAKYAEIFSELATRNQPKNSHRSQKKGGY